MSVILLPLLLLKIPTGFAVCYNKFHDIEPITSKDSDETLENWGYFTEDILQIVKMELRDGNWFVPNIRNIVIDLGWYPDGNANGQYRLVVAKVQEDYSWDILKEKVSRNRFEIRDTLEDWMQSILNNALK